VKSGILGYTNDTHDFMSIVHPALAIIGGKLCILAC
jgi:hypothetical protein